MAYKNIRKAKKAIAPVQKEIKGIVSKRGKGRPAMPNKKKYSVKMDVKLHDKVVDRAQELGTSNAFVICEGVKLYFDELKKKNQ